MEISSNEVETKVQRLKDERDFYLLIERKLEEDGYQLLDTLKRVSENNTFASSCLSDCY